MFDPTENRKTLPARFPVNGPGNYVDVEFTVKTIVTAKRIGGLPVDKLNRDELARLEGGVTGMAAQLAGKAAS